MGISETKKRIVIDNYFKRECDINTSIREAFEKGFELGLQKAPNSQRTGKWIHQYKEIPNMATFKCSCCCCVDEFAAKYCSNCGARMEGVDE